MTNERGEQNPVLVARLKYCRQLPTLPAVALQLVDLANDPAATLAQFAELTARDPALASKLLRVSNSSFYGRRRAVTNLSQALNLLGLNATITLSLSFSLRGSMSGDRVSGFDVARYWRRSLLTALACRTIAIDLRETQPEEFFLAGLLQDIGILVMDAELKEAYATLYGQSTSHEDLLIRESAAFGFNHAEAGTWLLREWQLPDLISDSVLFSHDTAQFSPENIAHTGVLPVCVAVAAGVADAWLEGATPDALEAAREPAQSWLDISSEQYQKLITTMARQIPDLETLFDTVLVDRRQIENAEDSAKEILVARNLQLLQSAVDTDTRTRALERRTTSLEEQARRDAMTGLFNRTYLERVLEHEFARANRGQHPFSVAFVDVDRFKTINDTYGHAAGDQVIVGVARRLTCQVRQTDIVSRYGGEEFVVLLTDTRTKEAKAVMARVLSSIRDTPFQIPGGKTVTVTVSAGVATHMEKGLGFDSAEALLEAADHALYTAKHAGRGRVMVHRGSHEAG